MHFMSTWLCEARFSASPGINNKTRNKLTVEPDQRCAQATTGPRLNKIVPRCNNSHLTDAALCLSLMNESLFNRVVSYVNFSHFFAIALTRIYCMRLNGNFWKGFVWLH